MRGATQDHHTQHNATQHNTPHPNKAHLTQRGATHRRSTPHHEGGHTPPHHTTQHNTPQHDSERLLRDPGEQKVIFDKEDPPPPRPPLSQPNWFKLTSEPQLSFQALVTNDNPFLVLQYTNGTGRRPKRKDSKRAAQQLLRDNDLQDELLLEEAMRPNTIIAKATRCHISTGVLLLSYADKLHREKDQRSLCEHQLSFEIQLEELSQRHDIYFNQKKKRVPALSSLVNFQERQYRQTIEKEAISEADALFRMVTFHHEADEVLSIMGSSWLAEHRYVSDKMTDSFRKLTIANCEDFETSLRSELEKHQAVTWRKKTGPSCRVLGYLVKVHSKDTALARDWEKTIHLNGGEITPFRQTEALLGNFLHRQGIIAGPLITHYPQKIHSRGWTVSWAEA